jgi:precorrin-6B methylase 1
MAVEIGAVDHADTVCGWEADLSVMETAHDAKAEAAGLAAPGTDAAALAVVDSPVCEGQVAVVAHGRAAHKD